MARENDCPLKPALLELLQASVDLDDTSTTALARALRRAPSTVRTQFQQIEEMLGVHSRGGAVIYALKRGWITLPPLPRRMSGRVERLSAILPKNTCNCSIDRPFRGDYDWLSTRISLEGSPHRQERNGRCPLVLRSALRSPNSASSR